MISPCPVVPLLKYVLFQGLSLELHVGDLLARLEPMEA